jgi:3-methyladenine DNA glycosylase AlkD
VSHTTDVHALLERLDSAKPTNTEIRSIAQEQGRNHELAAQLWKHGGFSSRMLSLLILDLKTVDLSYIEMLISDIENADGRESNRQSHRR